MKILLLFYITLVFYIVLQKSLIISAQGIHLQHGDHSITIHDSPQKENPKISCKGEAHPYANDCTKFIECYNGVTYIKDCAPGTTFDKNLLFCNHKHNVNCDYRNTTKNRHTPQPSSSDTTDMLCPWGTVGIYSYPFNHNYYLKCIEPRTLIKQCSDGTKFNITQGICTAADIPQTEQPLNYDPYKYLYKCPSQAQEKYLYPFNASKYIQCSRGTFKVMDCDPLEVFDNRKKTCQPKIQVPHYDHVLVPTPTDSSDPARLDDIIDCPMNLFGLFPHPFSNEKYLQCVDGRLYAESCRTGFVYDIFSKFCERNLTNSFSTLPPIQNNYTAESEIETRSNDSLTFLKCPADLVGKFIHPFYCTKYINCLPAGTNIATCSTGEIYSFRRDKCMLQSEMDENAHVECSLNNDNKNTEESLSDSLGVHCASTGTMKYPHPENWYKYVLCDNGKLQVKFCPRNTAFNLEIRECINEKEATKM